MFNKIGENLSFSKADILTPKEALSDPHITKRFIKLAKKLKRIAPKANDFLYGHAVIMHAAEAAAIDQNTGEPMLVDGKPISVGFEPIKLKNGKDSVKWVSSKKDLQPYRNANGDIFPEDELLKAYKGWVGKPLCKDHKSDSVDGIRGIIVDTHYDPKFKRVHALFALDRKNYGDLARKVETGYANSVSMGTAVGRSVCTDCGNVATVEREYCKCVRGRSNYGEINLDLNPIELSLVVNGADGLAKVKNIIASMNAYAKQKQERVNELISDRCVNPNELQDLSDSLSDMQKRVAGLISLEKKAEADFGELAALLKTDISDKAKAQIKKLIEEKLGVGSEELSVEPTATNESTKAWPPTGGGSEPSFSSEPHDTAQRIRPDEGRFASKLEGGKQGAFSEELRLLRSQVDQLNKSIDELKTVSKEENNMNSARLRARAKARRAYFLGGGGVNEPTPGKEKYPKEDADKIRDNEDKQMTGTPLETGSEGLHPGDEAVKKEWNRDGLNLSKAELEDRKMKRRAYWLGGGGVNEPTPGKEKYPKEEADKVRDTEDKQVAVVKDLGGKDGMVPGDEQMKKMLLRAKLRAKFTKVADEKGAIRKDASRWDVFAGDKLILTATGSDIYGEDVDKHWDYLSSKDYGKDVIRYIRSDGFERVAYLLKGAADPMAPAPVDEMVAPADPAPEAPAEEPKEKEDDSVKGKVEAVLAKIEENIDNIRAAVNEGDGQKLVDVEVTVDKDELATPSPMDEALASTNKAALEIQALMDDSADELALISEAFEQDLDEETRGRLNKAASAALADSELILAEAAKVLAKKKDKEEVEEKDKEEDKKDDKKKDKEEVEEKDKEDEDDEEKGDKEKKAASLLEEALRVRAQNRASMLKAAEDFMLTPDESDDEEVEMDMAYDHNEDCGDDCGEMSMADEEMDVEEDPAMVMAARKAARDELVAQASEKILGKYELDLGKAENANMKEYFDAHPGGKGTVTELTHTKTDEAKVETISEVHDVMRDVAESGPRNVREAAALIQEGIVKGAFTANDLDTLVAEGKVDSAAAAYWKKYFGQAPDAGSFGADLSKEFVGKKKEASDDTYKIKLRRAYDLGLEAQKKGFIEATRASLDTYVDEIMQLDDSQFESTKRVIAKMAPAGKKSGALPRVGVDAAAEAMNVTASAEPAPTPDLVSQLNSLGWK
jgi:hypothetical protein